MILFRLTALSFVFCFFSTYAQEDFNSKKISPLIEFSAQTPLQIQNGFYNKNAVVFQFFRSSYGLGIRYQLNEKWAINTVANYNHRFMGQRFYFNDTLLLAGLDKRYFIQEIGLKIGGLRTLSLARNSNLSVSFSVEPWVNLPKKDEGVSSLFPDDKKNTQLIIYDPIRLQMNCSIGLRYEYFRSKMSLGFSTDLIVRSAKRTNFSLVAEDYFSYQGSYTTTAFMLGITGFISF